MNPARLAVRFFRPCLAMTLFATCALAQSSGPSSRIGNATDETSRVTTHPLNRVRGPVTDARTPLKGQTRPMNRAAVDLGEAPTSMSTGRMVLWLRRSAKQQAQLSQFLSHAQNPGSASYRHWMTPDSYGATYGISDSDLAAVQQWLQTSGLKVERVSAARNAILFSGTAGSLARAFHTSIHSYVVGQQTHFSNATDPEIPTALAPVISGVSPMNNFHARPMHVLGKAARYNAASRRVQPAITGNDPNGNYNLFVTPADASIIYNTPNQNFNPAATQTLDGTGVSIGILGYSALAMANVQNYRTAFLPASAASNLPHVILDGGTDPGVMEGGYAVEALLDVEVAGGLAPGAAINYYYAASSDISDGLILAGLRALEENKVNILSASYGSCEADLGPGGNLAWSELWQQAAAQGITVTVSTGDSGSATCDGDTSTPPVQATRGLSVNGFASTPYNIAVGGTDLYSLAGNFSTYVNTATTGNYPYYATALSYIPENPWNDSSAVVGYSFTENSPAYDGSFGTTDIIGGGGGLSSQAVCPGTIDDQGYCSDSLTGYAQPAFQTGFQSINPVRSIPDVALLAGNGFYGAAWVFCVDSATAGAGGNATQCQVDSNGHLIDDQNVGTIGGTSASAPAFAGMLAMISQSQGGARLGQANTVLYNLAQNYNPDPSNPGKYQRAFHDIAIGNNSVYCASGSQDCNTNNFLEGYNATPSYDMATGLGSIDLSQLISLWTATNFASTSNTLAAGTSVGSLSTAPISVVHGTPLYFATTVAPSTATGQFSLLVSNSANATSLSDVGMLGSNGTGNLTTNDLPGGTYTVSAYYAGDTNNTGSQSSNNINLTISAEPSTIKLFFGGYDPITFLINEDVNSMPYGVVSYVNAQPYGNSSTIDANGNPLADGVASGSVTFTSNGTTQSAAINSVGVAQIPVSSLTPGTYTYQASYPGDASFAPSNSAPQTLTITRGITSFTMDPSESTVIPVGAVYLTATLQTDSVAAYPTGNVLAAVNGHTYPPSFNNYRQSNGVDTIAFDFVIPATDLTAGSNIISVSYGGDANYLASSAGATVTLTGVTGNYSLSGPTQPVVVKASQQGSTTISVVPSNGFIGQVNMACTVTAASAGHTPICQAAAATVYGSTATTSVSVASYADTPAGTYTITVTGTSGQQSQSVQIPLQVTAGPSFTLAAATSSLSIATPGQAATDILSIAPTQAFTGNVVLSCTIAPTPTSGSAPACTLPGSVVFGSSTSNPTLQVTTDGTTPPGSYSIAVTAVSGVIQQTLIIPFTIQQPPATPTFGLSAANSSLSIATPGQLATDIFSIAPTHGFTGTVVLSCTIAPTPTSGSAPACTLPGNVVVGSGTSNATLQVTSDSTTPPGSYSVAVTAVSGVIQQTLTVPLNVQQPPAAPTFWLSPANSTLSIAAAGQPATDTLTINPAGGFTGTVQLSCVVSQGAPSSASSAVPICAVPAMASVTGTSAVNTTLMVHAVGSSVAVAPRESRLLGERVGGLALSCLLAFVVPRRRRVWTALGLLVLTAGTLGITGCSGGGQSSSGTGTGSSTGTPAGNYTVMVTAASGSITTTTQILVTVQ